jgi:hypothetical protein
MPKRHGPDQGTDLLRIKFKIYYRYVPNHFINDITNFIFNDLIKTKECQSAI